MAGATSRGHLAYWATRPKPSGVDGALMNPRENEVYREIVEGLADGIVLLDQDACIVYANPAAERIIDKRLADMAGKPVFSAVAESIGSALRNAEHRLVAGLPVELLPSYVTRERAYEVCASLKEKKVLLCFRDITERQRMEDELRASEERVRLAVATAQIAVWEYFPQTGRLMFGPRAKGVWGLPPNAELDYEAALAAVHPGDRQRVEAEAERVFRRDKDGEYD